MNTLEEMNTVVYSQPREGLQVWEFFPKEEHPINQKRKENTEKLELALKFLPDYEFSVGEVYEYPETSLTQFKAMLGKFGKMKIKYDRRFFVVGDFAFFQRYTSPCQTDWMYHPLWVHYTGYSGTSDNFVEIFPFFLSSFQQGDDVTREEMASFLNFKVPCECEKYQINFWPLWE